MRYSIRLKPRAIKDLSRLGKKDYDRILIALEKLEDDLNGDVKRLTNFTPEYRLRVGDIRILFEIENESAVIYRIKPRKDAYR